MRIASILTARMTIPANKTIGQKLIY